MASPFSETEVKPNPYQKENDGPKGAYEARKVDGGLYVRVDMPGVPPENVKVIKISGQRTVTFTGKTPPKSATGDKIWDFLVDLSYRVYGGYVALDRNPADVEFKYEVKGGVLRLFFPDCDGSLHFLSPPARTTGEEEVEDCSLYDTDGTEYFFCRPYGTGVGETPEPYELSGLRWEDREPQGDDETEDEYMARTLVEAAGHLKMKGGKEEHINPFVLNGPKGVYGPETIKEMNGRYDDGLRFFVRLDVPGVSDVGYKILEKDRCVIASARGLKDSLFDEGGREYYCMLSPKCTCCKYNVLKHELTNGVLKYLICCTQNYLKSKEYPYCKQSEQ